MAGPPAARAVLDHARSRPPRLGDGRLVCLDGPAGSGKTTLGEAVLAEAVRVDAGWVDAGWADAGWADAGWAGAGYADAGGADAGGADVGWAGSARLLHMDDCYEGWAGLGDVATRLWAGLLGPLAAGLPGRYRRWDWVAGGWAEERVVEPVDLLVLEGVGSGCSQWAEVTSTLVWVAAPRRLRMERGVARDGEALRTRWQEWQVAETAHFAQHRTRERADLLVDGFGRLVAESSTEPGGR